MNRKIILVETSFFLLILLLLFGLYAYKQYRLKHTTASTQPARESKKSASLPSSLLDQKTLEQIQTLEKQGRFSQALTLLHPLLQKNPHEAELLSLQTRLSQQQTIASLLTSLEAAQKKQDWDQAITDLQQLLLYKPTDTNLQDLLHQLYHHQWAARAREAESKNLKEEAKKDWEKALTFYTDPPTQAALKRLDHEIMLDQQKKRLEQYNQLLTHGDELDTKQDYLQSAQFYRQALPYADTSDQKEFLQYKISSSREKYQETQKLYHFWMKKARQGVQEKKYAEALQDVEQALTYRSASEEAHTLKKTISFQRSIQNMILIPPGPAQIGDEKIPDHPLQTLQLPTFYIDQYEVTNEDYQWFVQQTHHEPPPYWFGGTFTPAQKRHPVMGVNLSDAQAYCQWLGKRLPTEAEWEKAARGAQGLRYPWGNTSEANGGNFSDTGLAADLEIPKGWQAFYPAPAGSFPKDKSPYGVYDMAGNVLEWTATKAKIHKKMESEENKAGQLHRGNSPSKTPLDFYILKGGSFLYPVSKAFSANRFYEEASLRLPGIGFRCVKDVKNP